MGAYNPMLWPLTDSRGVAPTNSGIAILGKIVKNIRSHPGEQKYRSIKLENPTFRGATQGCHTEAVAFLQHVGFILSEDSAQLVYTRNDPGLLWLADSLLGAASR